MLSQFYIKKAILIYTSIQSHPLVFFVVFFFRANPLAYGSSQARGPIGAAAGSHSHSNVRSKPRLQATTQLMVMSTTPPFIFAF